MVWHHFPSESVEVWFYPVYETSAYQPAIFSIQAECAFIKLQFPVCFIDCCSIIFCRKGFFFAVFKSYGV